VTPPGRATPLDSWSAPELPQGASLVALVPAVDDLDRAAAVAWEFARRAARSGRRVALIDCYVDAPRLHAVAGEPNGDGIVDVFDYGASLSRIARAQPEGTLFFVPAGTFAPDPVDLMARPRWARLSAGFRHEDAVMLLFLPPACIEALVTPLDGLVALAPGNGAADSAGWHEIQAAAGRGVPLLGTFTGDAEAEPAAEGYAAEPFVPEAPAPTLAEPRAEREALEAGAGQGEYATPVDDLGIPEFAVEPPPGDGDYGAATLARYGPDEHPLVPGARMGETMARQQAAERRARLVRNLVALGVVVAVAGAVWVFRGQFDTAAAPAPSEPVELPARMTPGFRALVPHAVDSLPFAVQVAAWTTLGQALEDADSIEARGFEPIVTPLLVDRARWFRVSAGPAPTEDSADSLLRAVRGAGLDGSSSAAATLVPLSFALKRVATLAAARAERARLRDAGIPAFILGQADGSYRLFAGAFASTEQAAYLDTLLAANHSAAQLMPRVGYRP